MEFVEDVTTSAKIRYTRTGQQNVEGCAKSIDAPESWPPVSINREVAARIPQRFTRATAPPSRRAVAALASGPQAPEACVISAAMRSPPGGSNSDCWSRAADAAHAWLSPPARIVEERRPCSLHGRQRPGHHGVRQQFAMGATPGALDFGTILAEELLAPPAAAPSGRSSGTPGPGRRQRRVAVSRMMNTHAKSRPESPAPGASSAKRQTSPDQGRAASRTRASPPMSARSVFRHHLRPHLRQRLESRNTEWPARQNRNGPLDNSPSSDE